VDLCYKTERLFIPRGYNDTLGQTAVKQNCLVRNDMNGQLAFCYYYYYYYYY